MQDKTATKVLPVASAVRIRQVDPYGMQGRDPHPPVRRWKNPLTYEWENVSPCDGKTAYVIGYMGWENGDGQFFSRHVNGEDWQSDRYLQSVPASMVTPEDVYSTAPTEPDEFENFPTHFYRLLVPDVGIFDFTDYELDLEDA